MRAGVNATGKDSFVSAMTPRRRPKPSLALASTSSTRAASRHADGDRVVEVDRADEVALLAFVAEPTHPAARVHGEPAGVERRAAAARAAQAEPAPEDAEHTPRPASVRASAARRAPVQIEEPTSGRADDGVRRRHEEEDAPAEGATCGRHQRAS